METLPDKSYWEELAGKLHFPCDLLIDGKWQNALSGKRFLTINPATGSTLAAVAEADCEDVNLAVVSARVAFKDGRWSGYPRESVGNASSLLPISSKSIARNWRCSKRWM